MILKVEEQRNTIYILFFIILVGFALRIICIFHHLPQFPCIDENLVVRTILRFRISGLSPRDFIYPGLLYYLLLPLFVLCNLFLFPDLMNVTNLDSVSILDLVITDILIGRIFIVVLAILHIFAVYAIGKRLFNLRVGIIAALFLALNPLHASLSYIVKPDMLMSLLILIGFLFIYNLYSKEESKCIDYIFIGIFIGLATAAKYNGILGIIPLFVAHFLKSRGKFRFINKNLFLALFFVVLIFFLINPFIILDFRQFFKDIVSEFNTALQGFSRNPLANRQGWINYPIALFNIIGPGIFILFICGLFLSVWRHSGKDILVLSFPITYYIIMGGFKNSPAHHLLPSIPFILLLAAQFLIMLVDIISRNRAFKEIKWVVIFLLYLIFILPSFYSVIYYNKWINQEDTRILAKEWIKNNIPAGAKILMDGVSEDTSFMFDKIDKHPYQIDIIKWKEEIDYPRFFNANNFDFIVIQEIKNRPAHIKPLYDFINEQFLMVKRFEPFFDKPIFPFIYSPLYNPRIRIYDGSRK